MINPPFVEIPTFRKAVGEYRMLKGNACGGKLHVILDDFNVKDADISYCYTACYEQADWLGLKILDYLHMWCEDSRRAILHSGDPKDFIWQMARNNSDTPVQGLMKKYKYTTDPSKIECIGWVDDNAEYFVKYIDCTSIAK